MSMTKPSELLPKWDKFQVSRQPHGVHTCSDAQFWWQALLWGNQDTELQPALSEQRGPVLPGPQCSHRPTLKGCVISRPKSQCLFFAHATAIKTMQPKTSYIIQWHYKKRNLTAELKKVTSQMKHAQSSIKLMFYSFLKKGSEWCCRKLGHCPQTN